MAFSNSGVSWILRLGIFAVIVVIAMCVGAFFLVRYLYRTAALDPFQPSLQQYLAAAPQGEKKPTEGVCKPGMIAVDLRSSTLDHFYFEMPGDLRASHPASVKTVVFLQWDKIQTHKYSNGRPGYTQTCAVDVVDLETKTLVKKALFQGGPPPSSIRGRSQSAQGSSPSDQVVLFLQQNTAR
jgi:hypothetical protein